MHGLYTASRSAAICTRRAGSRRYPVMATQSGEGIGKWIGFAGLLAAWAVAVAGMVSLLQVEAGVVNAYRSVWESGDAGAIARATVGDGRLWGLLAIPAAPLLAFLAGRYGRSTDTPALQPDSGDAIGVAADHDPVDPQGVALRLLATLQEEARLLDFVAEDVPSYSDQEVGAAARGVHAGLVRALGDRVKFEPLRSEEEGESVQLEPGYSPAELRLSGSPTGEPPWKGQLVHPGWVATLVELPQPLEGSNPLILAPAEVEVDAG